ncbi:MAG: nicotinate phosphoribosyltransferase [Acidimicrobiales bacterium]
MVRSGEALFTDLYELTMVAAYRSAGRSGVATFDLFVRSLPPRRRFLVAAGLADVLDHLESLSVTTGELDPLARFEWCDDDMVELLRDLRFTGEVLAVPEGEVVFAGEPLLRVTAPLIEAQVVETRLLNLVASQTMVASKAARVALACAGRSFVDFGARRAHGADAAMQAARCAVIAGASGTSLVSAGLRHRVALSGTMAHSFVMSFDDEVEAFRAYARRFPDGATLLIDTYDTERGARRAVEVAHELRPEGVRIGGVRLDSGDLVVLSHRVRRILDDGGLTDAVIVASGDLDEYRIAEMLDAGAPIDAFGVGTQMVTSADAPSLGAVYKLVHDDHGPKIKLAPDKVTLPGRKALWRVGSGDRSHHDVVALDGEPISVPDGYWARPLLETVMTDGRRVRPDPSLDDIKDRCRSAVAALPDHVRSLESTEPGYEVRRSPGVEDLVRSMTAAHEA